MNSDTPSTVTTIALVQMTCGESKQANVDKAIARIEDAAAQGAEFILLQELIHNQYRAEAKIIVASSKCG